MGSLSPRINPSPPSKATGRAQHPPRTRQTPPPPRPPRKIVHCGNGHLGRLPLSHKPRLDVDRLRDSYVWFAVEAKSESITHRVNPFVVGRRRQRPGRMVDLAAKDLATTIGTVETVTGRQPVFQRTCLRLSKFSASDVVCVVRCSRFTAVGSVALVGYGTIVAAVERHGRIHVGKVECRTRHPHGHSAFGIE